MIAAQVAAYKESIKQMTAAVRARGGFYAADPAERAAHGAAAQQHDGRKVHRSVPQAVRTKPGWAHAHADVQHRYRAQAGLEHVAWHRNLHR